MTESVRSFQVPETPLTRAWPPSFPFRAHLAGHARHFRGEARELVDHRVHGRADPAELAADGLAVDLELDPLRQVAVGDCVDHARNLDRRPREVVDQLVDGTDLLRPRARRALHVCPLVDAPLTTHDPADPNQLARHLLVPLDERVECGRDLCHRAFGAQPHAEIAVPRGLERGEQPFELGLGQRRRSVPGTRPRCGLSVGLRALAGGRHWGHRELLCLQRGTARSSSRSSARSMPIRGRCLTACLT